MLPRVRQGLQLSLGDLSARRSLYFFVLSVQLQPKRSLPSTPFPLGYVFSLLLLHLLLLFSSGSFYLFLLPLSVLLSSLPAAGSLSAFRSSSLSSSSSLVVSREDAEMAEGGMVGEGGGGGGGRAVGFSLEGDDRQKLFTSWADIIDEINPMCWVAYGIAAALGLSVVGAAW